MGMAKLDRTNPPRLTASELAHLDAFTPAEIERNANEDAENPPLTADELDRFETVRLVQSVRKASDLSQAAFAATYGIALSRLRSWEQGRSSPDGVARAYLETIRHEPAAVARALRKAARLRA